MLIDKPYRRNKSGQILKRETVEIRCDKCGIQWESLYGFRKNKTLKEDLCKSCRSKTAWTKPASDHSSREIACSCCSKLFLKIPSLINNSVNYCSIDCRDKHNVELRYSHLHSSFRNNPDEVAYLIGLILGDGHCKKSAKRTTRICIAFDVSGQWNHFINLFKSVADKLGLMVFEEPKSHKHCQMIGFVLPDELLNEYGALYSGNKFTAQPKPSEKIIANINYAAGLLNSDGCFSNDTYAFHNTVKSIADSFSMCLSLNGIHHTRFEYDGRFDKRTNRTGLRRYQVNIATQQGIERLHQILKFETKGIKK